MPEQTTISLSPDEIISIIENNYCDSRLNEVIQILLRVEHAMPETDLLKELLNKNILNISSVPYLKYRFEKYFAKYGFEKVSQRKEFIFSKIPNYEGLNRGKAASYEDLVYYVEQKYPDLFLEILSEIKIYDFSPSFKENGRLCTLYFNRKLNPKANYKFNSKTKQYELKEDEVTELLRRHNIQFEVDNPAALFTANIKFENAPCRMPFWKIILLVIFWPIGLYYLLSKKNRSTNV